MVIYLPPPQKTGHGGEPLPTRSERTQHINGYARTTTERDGNGRKVTSSNKIHEVVESHDQYILGKKKKQKMHTDDRTRQEEGLHRFKSDKRQIVEERNDCHEKFRHIK